MEFSDLIALLSLTVATLHPDLTPSISIITYYYSLESYDILPAMRRVIVYSITNKIFNA